MISSSTGRAVARLFVMGALVASGCNKDITAGTTTTGAAATPIPIPTPPGLPHAAANPAVAASAGSQRAVDIAPLGTGLNVQFLERQLFHPASRTRSMIDIRDTTKTRRLTGGGDFRIGLVLEARNDSEYLLAAPRVQSQVVIGGAHGEARCLAERDRYDGQVVTYLFADPAGRSPWVPFETSADEYPWRPGETIRVGVVLVCAAAYVQDIGIDALSGAVRLAAHTYYTERHEPCPFDKEHTCDDDIVGDSPALALPAHALVLQRAQLATGETGYSAGDLFVRAIDGRVVFETLPLLHASAFTATGTALPATAELGHETIDEWSMTLASAQVQPWTAVPGSAKGVRTVTVSATLAINAGAIEGRLRSAVTEAQAAERAAAATLATATSARDTAAAAAAADPNQQAAADAADAAFDQTESAYDDAASALADAQRNFDRSLGTERTRFARLLACDGVQLITQSRLVRPLDGRGASATCATLATGDSVQVTWTYTIGRYEIPLGITYALERAPHTQFFANAAFATFDPH